MLSSSNDLTRRRPSTFIAQGSAPELFPYSEWHEQTELYSRYWKEFTNESLQRTDPTVKTKSGKEAPIYPLEINAVRLFSQVHAGVILGEVADGSTVPYPICVRSRPETEDDSWKEVAKKAEYYIAKVWEDNHGRSIQAEGTLISQFLGGQCYRVTFSPTDDRITQIRIELIYPDFFLPIFRGIGPFDLLEAYMAYMIPGRTAYLAYGIEKPSSEYVLFMERWNKKDRELFVDGKAVDASLGGVPIGKRNVFGFVPYVYIPTLLAGGYRGLSIVEDIKKLSDEYNYRMADLGDAVDRAINPARWGKNLGADITVRRVDNLTVYDIGTKRAGVDGDPAVEVERDPALSQSLANIPETLWSIMLRVARIAPIALGEDEGSQRSALTLAFRMWPTTSRAIQVRLNIDVGMCQIAKYILRIASTKNLIPWLPQDWENNLAFNVNFAPLIPRDREQEGNTALLAVQQGIMSVDEAIRVIGITRDPDEEREKIRADKQEAQDMMMQEQRDNRLVTEQPIAASITEE